LTDAVGDTATGSAAADDVRMGRLGDLAGEGGTWLRRSSLDRKATKIHAPMLAAVLADFGLAIDSERHRLVKGACESIVANPLVIRLSENSASFMANS